MEPRKQIDRYHAGNLECAHIIAADPVKYPPDNLPGIWAQMILYPPAARTEPAIRRAA
jgi:hypothetical protein